MPAGTASGPLADSPYHPAVEGLVIRQARTGDGAGIAALHLDTAASLERIDPSRFKIPDVDGMADWIDHDLTTVGTDWNCFVALEDGEIVGQVEAKLHPPFESARFQTMADLGDVTCVARSTPSAFARVTAGAGSGRRSWLRRRSGYAKGAPAW
jgi:hypothetical protein